MSRTISAEGYTPSDAARMLQLSPARVRSYIRAGFLKPRLGPEGEVWLTFQDLVVLRAAKDLLAAHIPSRRVRTALARIQEQLPEGAPLTGVHISADGTQVVARDGAIRWNPESGQALLDFDVAELGRRVGTLPARVARAAGRAPESAEQWYDAGCELEASDPAAARDAYRRAVELDPEHFDAWVNMGRLLHAARELAEAFVCYRRALALRPDDPTARFNLGVALEDEGRTEAAVAAYEAVLDVEPRYADAHYNLSGLHERKGDQAAALRHLSAYKKISGR